MLARLFTLFLFFCVLGSCIADASREVIVLFKGDKTKVPFEDNGKTTMKTARSFRIPAFVGGVFSKKDLFVVLCDVRYDSISDWGAIEGASRISYGNYKEWRDVEIFAPNTRKNRTHSVLGDPTAVIKDDKIYVLASSWDESGKLWVDHESNSGWEPLMVVGTVTNRTGAGGDDVFVKWEKGISLKDILSTDVLGFPGFQFIGGVGNGVVTKNGTIVFPIQISNTKGKYSSSIVYSTDDGDSWEIGNTAEIDSTEASVVEWGDDKLILFARYDKGYRRVYESDDLGATWEKSLMFSHVWGNDNSRTGVGCQGSAITVPVEGEDILLFSHPLNKKGKYSRDTLQLWISDGQRIKCVGTISEEGKGDTSGYSILAHIGDNLYITYEINPFADWNHASDKSNPWNRAIAFSPLPKLFESAKNTARAWRELDTKYKTVDIPTEALVGFLGSAKTDNSVWDDVYSCVDATVNGGERVIGGFRFNGAPESGAKWPVAKQGQNQVYKFTERQFTLAATLIVHNTSRVKDVLLLGASANTKENDVLFGIGYTKSKKWFAAQKNGKNILSQLSMEQNKEYLVTLTFGSGVVSVFVDGKEITKEKIKMSGAALISHFFMGGTESFSAEMGNFCTVRNVMLFSRDLQQAEIAQFTKMKTDTRINKPVATTQSIIVPEVIKPEPTNQYITLPEKRLSLPQDENTEELGAVRQMMTNGKGDNQKNKNALHEHRDVASKGKVKRDSGATVKFSAVTWMFFVFIFILITGF